AEEAHHEREGPGHLREDIERQHDELRLSETCKIAAEASRAHTEKMDGKKHDDRQGSRRLNFARWRLDSGNQAREISYHEEDKECAKQRQERPRIFTDHLLDLLRDAADDDLKHGLAPACLYLETARNQPAAGNQSAHDDPSCYNGSRDRNWT